LRDALSAARTEAKAGRQALIDEVMALGATALERDIPSRVKAIQARWQVHAKQFGLAQRDERALWEKFRTACDAVFEARHAKRKEEDGAKREGLRVLETICADLEQLAAATDKDDHEVRRILRALDDQWRARGGGADPALRGVESRFRKAKSEVDAALAARTRSRAAAVWPALAAKEQLCDALDAMARAGANPVEGTTAASERWTALPALPPAWEKKMLTRRDGALRALAGESGAAAYVARIEAGVEARREILLELEIALGLESPAELKAQRLALQVKQLRDRFQSAASASGGAAGERLVAWCAEPGMADARDRERSTRVFAAIGKAA
jgi:hypothetical protein